MDENIDILQTVSISVIEFIRRELPSTMFFHNIDHTIDVVRAVSIVGVNEDITAEELEAVKIAAWFHDVGYYRKYIGHEDESAKLAAEFLTDHAYPANKIDIVISCIEATRHPRNPLTLQEKILCDADLHYLSRADYQRFEKNLRREWGAVFNRFYSDEGWARDNCELLFSHRYFTEFGKRVLQPRKEQNIIKMQSGFQLL